MSRGQVLQMEYCNVGNHPSLRVWPVKYNQHDIAMCQSCIKEAADRGGMIDATELGGDMVFLPGPDITVQQREE